MISGTLNLQQKNSEVNVQLLAGKPTSFFIKKPTYIYFLFQSHLCCNTFSILEVVSKLFTAINQNERSAATGI